KQMKVSVCSMDHDSARSGGFEPLRMLPKGKRVVLGIVTTKTGRLESKDDLRRRIGEAQRYAPLAQLCLSGQCGFASTEEGNVLTEDEQWAKLARIVEVAEEVWGWVCNAPSRLSAPITSAHSCARRPSRTHARSARRVRSRPSSSKPSRTPETATITAKHK